MKRRELLLGTLGFALPLASDAEAQTQPPRPSPEELAQRKADVALLNRPLRTALQTLPEAQLPQNGLWLIVNDDAPPAQITRLQQEQWRSQNVDYAKLRAAMDLTSLEGITKSYGRVRRRFGRIIALVPETMTVLHADPKLGDSVPLGELVSEDPLGALMATLSDSQFDALLAKGLTFGQLTPDQASLLTKALPNPLRAAPSDIKPGVLDYRIFQQGFPADQRKALQERAETQTLLYQSKLKTFSEREIRSGLRLRLYQSPSFSFDVPGKDGYGFGLNLESGEWQGEKWALQNGGQKDYGKQQEGLQSIERYLKSESPNQLKPSELSWELPALMRAISLGSVKTVGDIVKQAAAISRLELFCDPRFAAQSVLLLGEASLEVPLSELLKALTLSLCGTWRRLGPGFMLTHHTQGRAQIHAVQSQIVKRWRERAKGIGKSNATRLLKRDWLKTVGAPPGDPHALPDELRGRTRVPLSELPKALQAKVRAALERDSQPPQDPESDSDHYISVGKVLSALNDATPMSIDPRFQLTIELPETGPMALGQTRYPDSARELNSAPNAPIPAVEPIPIPESLRGVLAAAATPEAAKALVERVAALGFNTLFLAADAHGAPYFQRGEHTAPLAAALAAGKARGVAVWATVDVFCWRRDRLSPAPKPLPEDIREDRGLFGETNSEGVAAELSRRASDIPEVREFFKRRFGSDAYVSPFDPGVGKALTALTTELAKLPGLAGILFQRAGVPGYLDMDYYPGIDDLEFGFLPEVRLARARAGKPDPIDEVLIGHSGIYYSVGQNTTSLPLTVFGFDTPHASEEKDWQAFRVKTAKAVLSDIFQAARRAAPELPLLMRERKFGFNIEPWTDATKPHEMLNTDSSADELGQKASEKTVVVATVSPGARKDWRQLRDEIQSYRTQFGRGKSRSLILDLLSEDPSGDSLEVLNKISPYLTTKRP